MHYLNSVILKNHHALDQGKKEWQNQSQKAKADLEENPRKRGQGFLNIKIHQKNLLIKNLGISLTINILIDIKKSKKNLAMLRNKKLKRILKVR